jgi:hypothetical protein
MVSGGGEYCNNTVFFFPIKNKRDEGAKKN